MNNFFESKDNLIILDQIEFDAVYLENEHMVKISFKDKTNNTKFAILEILGMDVTYHQEYTFDYDSSFIEEVSLQEIPKYGWKTTPVILEIQHSEFGKISLKIEIHDPSESKPKIIVEQK
ncbi:hypothetical protein OAK01_05400 [Candidatus Nitrosopelagicus sp.]|nr:hypothetical protein [Candidatus Nitrosopelagicus sp.]